LKGKTASCAKILSDARQDYLQQLKIAPQIPFDNWRRREHPEVQVCINDKNRAALDVSYYLNKKMGGAVATMWSQQLADAEVAVTSHDEYIPGVTMLLDSGRPTNVIRKRRKAKRSNVNSESIPNPSSSFSSQEKTDLDYFFQTTNSTVKTFHKQKRDILDVGGYFGPSWATSGVTAALNAWRDPNNFDSNLHFTSTQNSESHSISDFSAGADFNIPIELFAVQANGGRDTLSTLDNTFQYEVTIDWRGMELVSVHPGQWYQPNFGMAALVDPASSPQPMPKEKFDQYYGPNGSLKRVTSRLLIGYQPVLTATMSDQTISTFKDAWTAGGGFCFLLFCVSPYGTEDKHGGKASFNGNQMTIAMNSDTPIIVAVGYDEYGSVTPVAKYPKANLNKLGTKVQKDSSASKKTG